MQIQSRFKDYYDYVPFLNGGSGDPKIFYDRPRFLLTSIEDEPSHIDFKVPAGFFPLRLPSVGQFLSLTNEKWEWVLRWVCVAGNFYLSFDRHSKDANSESFSLLSEGDPCFKDFQKMTQRMHHGREYLVTLKEVLKGKPSFNLVQLSREVGSPVFFIDTPFSKGSQKLARVPNETPILKNLGFSKVVPPTQMYQDISYFVGNTLNESPDLSPPEKVSDSVRLVQRGFDPKTSFRGKTK
jgi:hypothetical protein